MIYKLSLLIFLVFFAGCSLKPPANQWEYKSSSAFESYTKNFLSANDAVAHNELEKALKSAKQSADLEQLARIYLGKCGLELSIEPQATCSEYEKIQEFITSAKLISYYKMLNKTLKNRDIQNLPSQYQTFANYYHMQNYQEVFQAIQGMEQISSQFIAASLIHDKLSKSQINYLIDTASFYGYKKLVIFWIKQLIIKEEDSLKKERLEKKLHILQN